MTDNQKLLSLTARILNHVERLEKEHLVSIDRVHASALDLEDAGIGRGDGIAIGRIEVRPSLHLKRGEAVAIVTKEDRFIFKHKP